jgi:lipopolysaccharide export system permease protein
MLFDSSLRKELGRSFGATLVVLATIVMTLMLVRTLGMASKGAVNPSDVMMVMGYTLIGQLPIILVLSLFVAVVSTLSRSYVDSEMVIWLGSGISLARFIRPLLGFAWPILVVVTLLTFWGIPWSNQQIQLLRSQFEQRGDIERVAPGQFQESADGSRVFFIDKDRLDSQSARSVFIANRDPSQETLTMAQSAELTTENGQKILHLSHGERVELPKSADANSRIVNFVTYTLTLVDAVAANDASPSTKSQATWALWADTNPVSQGEFAWRVSMVLSGLNLVLLGLSLSAVRPRASRSSNLLLALFTFIVYFNLINISQSWIGAGTLRAGPLLVVLHGGIFLVGLLLLLRQILNWHIDRRRPLRSSPPQEIAP